MSILFDKDTDTIGLHIKKIFETGELNENSTTEDSSIVQIEGVTKFLGKQIFKILMR